MDKTVHCNSARITIAISVTEVALFPATNPSSPNWKPNADVNNDGVCNMRDIQIAILNFNKHE